MQLYYTPTSHFSRKVRVLLELYQVKYELLDVGNVADIDEKKFNNPLMKVPTLIDDQKIILESDHISQYLVRKLDDKDRYEVFSEKLFDLNARSILNGIMSEEVKIILGKRTNIEIGKYVFFDKAIKSIELGLEWLDSHVEQFNPNKIKYRDIHLVCALEHILCYKTLPIEHKNLTQLLEKYLELDLFKRTSPFVNN